MRGEWFLLRTTSSLRFHFFPLRPPPQRYVAAVKRRARTASIYNEKVDLAFLPGVFGSTIRRARIRSEQTLRGLAAMTGISHSEISKLESGNRECRMESFVQICAALGIPTGRLIDDITRSGLRCHAVVASDPEFGNLVAKISPSADSHLSYLAANLGSCCGWAMHLSRCSAAARAASRMRYPVEDLRVRFSSFARLVDLIEEPRDRLAIVAAFKSDSFRALRTYGLLSNTFVEYALADPTRSIWMPTPSSTCEPSEMGIDKLNENKELSGVRHTWSKLKKRLRDATAERGGRARLARFIGVSDATINTWLVKNAEPGAEATFRLLEWVEAEEAKRKSPDAVVAAPEQVAPKGIQANEVPKSGPPKRSHKKR